MKERKFGISAFTLHIFAMLFMLLDHMWATVVTGNIWMNYVGRLAFPIFAFMLAEGYSHTSNFNKYLKRMLIFALISEIPFNLMNAGGLFDPFHQNVMWTFLISLIALKLIDKVFSSDKTKLIKYLSVALLTILFVALGAITFVDYGGFGVLTVIMFYLLRGHKWWNYVGQIIAIYLINFVFLQNMDIPFTLFGREFFFPTQGFAIFSLIFIFLYNGKQGLHNKYIKYFNYLFYPVHILILSLIALWH